ncbi:hypothetical protein VTJ04DRAFT_1997 [Mycothermus thermophilus]|uniref:uncharacterized protein n=1 Tax=Humicola insolens TaxID=85995 RepID=UPI003743FC25
MKIEWAFCSLGDLITLAELTFHLGKVIEAKKDFDGQRAEEYEALERSISNFGNTLLKVVAVYEQCGSPKYLDPLDKTARDGINECRDLIAGALEYFNAKAGTIDYPGSEGVSARRP